MEIKLWKLSACINWKFFCFKDFTKLLAFFCVSKNINQIKGIKISWIKLNTSLYLNLKQKSFIMFTKLMTDTFSTHFCLDRCNWGTMKSLEIKIIFSYELFQNRFGFKRCTTWTNSWSIRKFWNFWFHCRIINTKNIYHQNFVVVHLMTYIFMLNLHYLLFIYII